MNSQASLFDTPPTTGRSRRNDPRTSTDAARSINVTAQREQILRLLDATTDGMTADELAARMNPQPHRSSVSARLGQLREEHKVEPFGVRLLPSGRRGQIWFRIHPHEVDVATGGRL